MASPRSSTERWAIQEATALEGLERYNDAIIAGIPLPNTFERAGQFVNEIHGLARAAIRYAPDLMVLKPDNVGNQAEVVAYTTLAPAVTARVVRPRPKAEAVTAIMRTSEWYEEDVLVSDGILAAVYGDAGTSIRFLFGKEGQRVTPVQQVTWQNRPTGDAPSFARVGQREVPCAARDLYTAGQPEVITAASSGDQIRTWLGMMFKDLYDVTHSPGGEQTALTP